MEWSDFGIEVEGDSVRVSDGDFSVGVDWNGAPDVQLLSSKSEDGDVVIGLEEADVEGDFEVLDNGMMIDVFGVTVKVFEPGSYWFEIGSSRFLYAVDSGIDAFFLEGNVDLAFLRPVDDLVLEAVRIRPDRIVVLGGSEAERREFAGELRDRNFDVEVT